MSDASDTSRRIRIAVADDHPVVREGLVAMLETQADFEIVGTAATGLDVVGLVASADPDVLLLDLEMPGMNLAEGFAAIRRRYPQLPIAIVSGVTDASLIRTLLDSGARGFIPKLAGSEQLLDALRRILAGEIYVPDALLGRQAAAAKEAGDALTARQLDILPLLAEGMPNKQIADALGVTEGTVKQHLKELFKRLSARNRTQAVQEARRLGLLRK